jgi:hypothetical protein
VGIEIHNDRCTNVKKVPTTSASRGGWAHRIGPAIKLAEPTASVQIPMAHRFR